MGKKNKRNDHPTDLTPDHVLELTDGRQFLVAVLNREGDEMRVTGTRPGGIGSCWVHKDQLRRANAEDRKALEDDAPADDDAGTWGGDDAGTDDNAGSSSGEDATAGDQDTGGSAA